jgi:hypothetical protein
MKHLRQNWLATTSWLEPTISQIQVYTNLRGDLILSNSFLTVIQSFEAEQLEFLTTLLNKKKTQKEIAPGPRCGCSP